MYTIKDVAQEAGTSIATVSRVLNGKTVREENYLRVKEAMKKLNFKVNIYARSLKTQKTMIVGIVIPDLSDVYFMRLAKVIQECLYRYGYSVFLVDANREFEREKEQVELLLSKKVDGLIVTPSTNKGGYLKEYAMETPIVLLDQLPIDFLIDAVVPDNISCVYEAVKDMLEKGHRRIGFIGGQPELFTVQERLKGYLKAFQDLGVAPENSLIKSEAYTEKCGYDFMKGFMNLPENERPSAVIATNYDLTKGAIVAVKEANVLIPEELSFVGYDFEELAFLYNPRLNIIVESIQEMGGKVVDVLVQKMNREISLDSEEIHRIKPFLMKNGSVKAPR